MKSASPSALGSDAKPPPPPGSSSSGGGETVRVVVRCRPLSAKEQAAGETSCVDVRGREIALLHCQAGQAATSDGGGGGAPPAPSSSASSASSDDERVRRKFAFDSCFGPESSQQEVYEDVGRPILQRAMDGYHSTIFAYGQTGSGKTHCMSGPGGDDAGALGIVPRMCREMFERIVTEQEANPKRRIIVVCSYVWC